MGARSVRLPLAVLLLLAVAVLFVSEGAEAGTWAKMDDYPSDFYHAASAVYDSESDRILLFETQGQGNDVYTYDHDSYDWEQMDDFPSDFYEAASAAYDSESDCILLFETQGQGGEVYAYKEKFPEWSYETGDNVDAVAISADGEYIAAGSQDSKVYLFEKDSSTPLWSYETGNNVGSVAISADGEYIAAHSDKLYLFGKDSNAPLWNSSESGISSVAISADGEYIVSGTLLFSKDSSTPLRSYETGSGSLYSISISADGKYIAGIQGDKVYLFDRDISTPLWSYEPDDAVRSVAISADGEYITAGSNDYKVYLFHKDSSTPLWSYETGHDVYSVSISADGDYITAGSGDSDVYLFSKDSSTPLWSYDADGNVNAVAVSADGKYVTATLAGSPKVYLFSKDNSTPLWSYKVGSNTLSSVYTVAISADGKQIVAGSYNDNVYAFENSFTIRPSLIHYGPRSGSDTHTNPQLGWFAGSDDRSNLTFDVYFDTDSDPTTKVADDITAFYYNTHCLDLNTKYYWKVVATDGTGSVNSSIMNFTVTTPGSIFCVSINDGEYDPDDLTIKIGNTVIWTNNDDSLHTVTSDDDEFDSGTIGSGNSWSYTFESTGTYGYHCEYHGSMTGTIEVVISNKPTATIDSISPQIAELYNSTSFSGHGNDTDGTIAAYLWSSSIDGELSTEASFSTADLIFGNHTIIFSVKDNEDVWSDDVTSWVDVRKSPEWIYDTGEADVRTIAISADGEYVITGADNDEVYLFGKDSSTPLWSYETTSGNVNSVSISSDGEYIVVGSDNGKVYFFDKDSSTPLWSYATESYVLSVAISADGEYIVAGSYDYKVYLFDKDSSTPIWSYTAEGNVESVSLSADGEYIVAGSDDGNVYFFDKDSSTPLWSYETGDHAYAVDISADGEYITAGSLSNSNIYLFSRDNGTPLWSYNACTEVKTVSISADGEYITAGCDGNSQSPPNVFLFDKDSSTPLWNYSLGDAVRSVAISADGEYVTAGSYDDKVYLFGKDSSTPLWNYTSGDDVWSVAISADGGYLVASSGDSNVYTFRNDPVPRPSIVPYGPRSGSDVLNATTLRWFPGSDDIANLTFDVYLSWIKTDVEDNNSAARVADDISNYTFSVSDLTEDKTYYWKVVATDTTGSVTSRIMEFYVLDTTGPITNITSGPSDPTGYSNATFTFTANEDDVTFECKLDTGSWHDCTSPATYYNLSRGDYHLFQVKGTDDSGNEGEADDWMWEILENEKPTASIDSISPQMAYLEHSVAFDGSGDDSDGSIVAYLWESSIGGIISNSANFSVSNLEFGNHTISFLVKDSDGDWSDEEVSWVNVTGPIAKITSVDFGLVPTEYLWTETHQNYTNQTHPWEATHSDPGDSWCSTPAWIFLDNTNGDGEKLWGPDCNDEFGIYYEGGEGNLTTDSWNLSSYPSNTYLRLEHRYNWVQYAGYETYNGGNVKVSTDNGENWSILKPVGGYPGTIYDSNGSYGNPLEGQEAFVNFSGGQNHPDGLWVIDYFDLSYYADLDDVKIKFHFGIYEYEWPGDGARWYIDNVSLVSGPLVPGVEFTGRGVSSDYAIEEYEWYSSIDGFLSNQDRFSSYSLSEGNHTILFRVKDSYGLWSDYANTTLDIPDTTHPVVNITSGPDNITVDTTAAFQFISNEDNSTFECALDGAGWVDCSSPNSYSDLILSTHSFAVRAIDQSNNTSDTAYWDWTIRSQYVVYIEDNAYDPSYIEIEPGYAVTWVNNDDTLHTVTADGDLFDSGGLGPGDEWSYYFDDAGTYDYHCEYHGSMSGAVNVSGEPGGNDPPTVWNIIIEPNPAYYGQQVNFSAEWEDTDGYVVAFEWLSDIDGLLSESGNFSSDTLSNGSHSIIFRVQDDDGAWSDYATSWLEVLSPPPNQPPTANITSIAPNPAIQETVTLTSGLLAYYPFNGNADDESGNGNHGEVSGGLLVEGLDGESGSAYYFNENSYITTAEKLIGLENSTASFWFKGNELDQHANRVSVISTASFRISIQNWEGASIHHGHKIFVAIPEDRNATKDSPTSYERFFVPEFVENEWNHIVVVINSDNSCSLFMNGEEISIQSTNVDYPDSEPDVTQMGPFTGNLDNVRIYDRVLSLEEIRALYTGYGQGYVTFTGFASDSDGTVVAYEWSSSLDGVLSDQRSFSYNSSLLSVGNHTITFRVQDNDGTWSDYASASLTVVSPANEPPVATLLISPNPVEAGETVQFTGNGSDADGNIVVWDWELDGESVAAGASFTRDNLAIGNHTVRLRVQDNDGAWSGWVSEELSVQASYTPWLKLRVTPLFNYDKHFIQVLPEIDLASVSVTVEDGDAATPDAALIRKQDDRTFDGFYDFTGSDLYIFTAVGIGYDGERISVMVVVPIEEVTTEAGEPLKVVHEAVGTSVTLVTRSGVTGKVSISISTIVPDLAADSGLIDVGLYFIIKVDTAILAELDYANVTIGYDPTELPEGLLEDALDIYHFDEANQTWEPTGYGGVNFEENYVWGHFSNFSLFAVFGSNMAPVADAGPDLKIFPGSQAVFFGTATDADGTIVLYEWDFDGDGAFDYSASDGIASHVYDGEGTFTVTLRVTDDEGATGFDETVVTVSESSPFAFLDSPLFRIFFPTVILLLAMAYYAYRKYGTLGAGALGTEKSKFALKKEKKVTVVCPSCGVDIDVPRLGKMQLIVCDTCGNQGEMEA